MFRKSKSPVDFDFARSGGSIITSQVDIWRAKQNEWELVKQVKFSKVSSKQENSSEDLDKGDYTCIFQCFVQESLNGKYDFDFSVAGKSTYADSGDVNTTAAPDDSKVYRDQFLLEVT